MIQTVDLLYRAKKLSYSEGFRHAESESEHCSSGLIFPDILTLKCKITVSIFQVILYQNAF